jgi:putative aldouronate transport system permease protein
MMELINKSTAQIEGIGGQYAAQVTTVTSFSLQVTAMVVSVVPIMCIYPFLQKYFVSGVTLGAVKG